MYIFDKDFHRLRVEKLVSKPPPPTVTIFANYFTKKVLQTYKVVMIDREIRQAPFRE